MSIISAARLVSLKAAVKAECQRRSRTGSVAAYGGTAYDYVVPPASGGTALKEHYEKLAIPLNAINATDTPNTDGARIISEAEISAMEAKVAAYAQRSIYDTSGTDCSASCTGMCYGCTSCTSCSGCSGCSNTCGGGCTGCGGDCTGSCVGGCIGGCMGGCTSCTNACSGCGKACSYDCAATCSLTCSGSCTGGCGQACSSNCAATCSLTCSGANK